MLLSGNNIDPQKEHYLLYRLPMARGQQYIHAYAVANGADTVWSDQKDDVFQRVQEIWNSLSSKRKNESKIQD